MLKVVVIGLLSLWSVALAREPAPSTARFLTSGEGGSLEFFFDDFAGQIPGVRLTVRREEAWCRFYLTAASGTRYSLLFAWSGQCVEPRSWPETHFDLNAAGAEAHITIGNRVDLDDGGQAATPAETPHWLVDDVEDTTFSLIVSDVDDRYARGRLHIGSAILHSAVTHAWPLAGTAVNVSVSFEATVYVAALRAGLQICDAPLSEPDRAAACWQVPIETTDDGTDATGPAMLQPIGESGRVQ